MMTVDS